MRALGDRIYPYSNGLLLGCELDVVLTNENSEPIDASTLFKAMECERITTQQNGGDEQGEDEGENIVKPLNGMARMYSKQSYCRGYATDNIWWMMKSLIAKLNRRANLSYVPVIHGEDFENQPDDMSWTAGGHIKCSIRHDRVYGGDVGKWLTDMTYKHDDESHERLKDNFRVTVGLLSLLLDRRETAEERRIQYGPFNGKEFRATENFLTYQTSTNWWIYAPMLAHLMLGATRMAYYITLNKIEPEIWDGIESGDVTNAIHHSSYEAGYEIWSLVNERLTNSGYRQGDNPFGASHARLIEFLMEYGVGMIGDGVYKNWRMSRKQNNYQGHFGDLAGWESGALRRVFTEKHPKYKLFTEFLERNKK
jgi:hypothetical protein